MLVVFLCGVEVRSDQLDHDLVEEEVQELPQSDSDYLMIRLFSAMTAGLFFGWVHFFIQGMSLKTIYCEPTVPVCTLP